MFTQGWFLGMFTHIHKMKKKETNDNFYAFPEVH